MIDKIRGLYLVQGYELPDFEVLEESGVTHIFFCEDKLLKDYTTCKNQINEVILGIEDTELKLFIDISPFQNALLQSTDPASDEDNWRKIDAISKLVTDISTIDGILFDDFFYPSEYYDPNNVSAQRQILVDFANDVSENIKNVNPDLQLSANVSWREIQASNINQLSGVFDFIICLIIDYNSAYIKNAILESQNPPVISITSAKTWLTENKPTSVINKMFKRILTHDVGGYALYAAPSIPEGLQFVNSCPVKMLRPNLLFYDI